MITKRAPLSHLTSIHLSGWVELCIIENDRDLQELENEGGKLIGAGSNLLVKTSGTKLYKLSGEFDYIQLKEGSIVCGAATSTKKLISFLASQGLSSVEFLAGIPATIGGCVRMNAGAFGGDIGEFVNYVKIFKNGKHLKLERNELTFSYRNSSISENIITEVALRFRKHDKGNIRNRIKEIIKARLSKAHLSNTFGSVFKNPLNQYAGELIEKVGLKGYRHNSASISPKHANFIIGKRPTEVNDVLFLIDLAKERVFKSFGVELEEEVEIV